MKRAAQVTIGTGILLLAGWWWLGQYPGMALARDKKQEARSVKVMLLAESGNRKSESGKSAPIFEVATVSRSDKEWANRLTIEQFRIGRTHGTERAFCGVFHDTKKNGVYFCAGCGR